MPLTSRKGNPNSFTLFKHNSLLGRTYKCTRCALHNEVSIMKNHSKICPYIYCECDKCVGLQNHRDSVNNKRRVSREGVQKLSSPINLPFLTTIDSQPQPQLFKIDRPNNIHIKKQLEKPLCQSKSPVQNQQTAVSNDPTPSTFQFITNQPLPQSSEDKPTFQLCQSSHTTLSIADNPLRVIPSFELPIKDNEQLHALLLFQSMLTAYLITNSKIVSNQ